jgi:hypothetical protein
MVNEMLAMEAFYDPHRVGLSSSCLPYAHGFLQIVPQLNIVGGFMD